MLHEDLYPIPSYVSIHSMAKYLESAIQLNINRDTITHQRKANQGQNILALAVRARLKKASSTADMRDERFDRCAFLVLYEQKP